jgi:hypothetical protein
MTRKTFLLILSSVFVLAIVIRIFWYDNDYSNPLHFSQYPTYGYYEIYPETILGSLNRGMNEVFTPASKEISDQGEQYDEAFHWSQSDYLKIANALSQEVWHESLDLEEWKVLYLSLDQSCEDNPQGFHTFSIVYFKNLGVEFWNRRYQARLIEVYPWQGLIRWGDSTFSDAIKPGWGNANLNEFKVTADGALLIAERNGGSEVRQEADNMCRISIRMNNYSPVTGYTNNNWLAEYGVADFYLLINPFTGEFKSN